MDKKILLVEDDPHIAQIYVFKLSLNGYVVERAENGLHALKLLKTFVPDLVLLDLNMPIMNGEAFLEKFRKITEHIATPVLILTNVSRDEAPKTIFHHGVEGYFVKAHYTPSELVDLVKDILQD